MKKGNTAAKTELDGATPPQTQTLDQAREILEQEAQGILDLARGLNSSFSTAVEAILNLPCEGRLIVSGIGKTSFVAMKISATFASIGVPSFFIHPAEAMHGDLGKIGGKDAVIILSNSGETPEIVRMVPALKKIGCLLIAITSDSQCFLAKRSHIVISPGKVPEAGPLGLAPTTSTTAMLALGDALAMAVLLRRPISREQFAITHPGGTLGRTLMLVSEVMRKGDEHCIVKEDVLVREVLQKITSTKGRPGAASVVGQDGILAGIFTDGDMRRCLSQKTEFLDLPISNVMNRTPKTVGPNVLAEEALKIISEYKIDQVIVVDDARKPVGMLDIQDVVQNYQ